MSDLTELLDELDVARAKATPGPWELDPVGLFASNDTGDLLFDYRDVVLVEDVPAGVAECTADGELIVAAVNAAPRLTAALRAVLALADEMAESASLPSTFGEFDRGVASHQRDAADRLRAAVASALADDPTPVA